MYKSNILSEPPPPPQPYRYDKYHSDHQSNSL